jgi:predicted PurR-regulated permease PerM
MAVELERADPEDGDDPPADAAAASRPDISRLGDLFGGPIDIRSVALTGIFVLLFFYTLYFARAIFLPIVLALLLSFLLAPAVRGFRRIGIPQAIGAAIVILTLLGGVSLGIYQLSGPAAGWIERAPEGLEGIERRIRQVRRPVEEVRQAAERVERQVERMAGDDGQAQEVEVRGGTLTGVVLARTGSFLGSAVVMIVLLYFLLASGDLFLRKLVRILPRLSDKKRAIEIARQTEGHISTYLSTITLINIALGITVGVAMRLVGMPNAVLWGVMAGLLNFIPYLGALATAGILAIVSVLTFESLGRALVAPLIYLAINTVEGYIFTPMLLGRRLTLNPVVIFLGIILWGWLWGIAGALLAVPILATFKIFCDQIEPLAPIGEFLGR